MSDYIDRQAAIKAVYSIHPIDTELEGVLLSRLDVRYVLEALPSADVEPVVRCKDCIFGHKCFDVIHGITDSWVECRNPDGLHRDVSCDGYCSAGEYNRENGR